MMISKTEKEGLYKTSPGSFVYDNKDDISNYRKQRAIHEAKEKEMEIMKRILKKANLQDFQLFLNNFYQNDKNYLTCDSY